MFADFFEISVLVSGFWYEGTGKSRPLLKDGVGAKVKTIGSRPNPPKLLVFGGVTQFHLFPRESEPTGLCSFVLRSPPRSGDVTRTWVERT